MSDHRGIRAKVLDMWSHGCTSGEIARDLKLSRPEMVRVIVQRARAKGDSRADSRRTTSVEPTWGLQVVKKFTVDKNVWRSLRAEADKRGCTENELVRKMVCTIAESNLYLAVLDDE